VESTLPKNDLLYHYTDAVGLLGILKDKCIFATDCRFENDPGELRYGLEEVALPLLREQPDAQTLTEFVETLATAPARAAAPYVACFSEHGDQLSQWRGYGWDRYTMSLGFSATALLSGLNGWNSPHPIRLVPVAYEVAQGRALFEDVILRGGTPRYIGSGSSRLWTEGDILDAAMACKHPKFSEEAEWRIIVSTRSLGGSPPQRPDDFRVKDGILLPYFKILLCSEGDVPPLKEVLFFPGSDPDGVVRGGIESALQACGYADVTVGPSAIPFRH
jgi:hypothetical protein